MVRRRLTLKRIDPWSVLKFGFVANTVLLVIFLLVALVVWMIIDRLAIVDQVCDIALDVGFTQCGISFGNLFRALLLLGLLWVVVQSAVLVFLSFLHNLLADLTGGLAVTVNDTTPAVAASPSGPPPRAAPSTPSTGSPPVPPLQRDRQTTAAVPRQQAPTPDPQAPDPGPPPRPRPRSDADSGEIMFGDRDRRRPEH